MDIRCHLLLQSMDMDPQAHWEPMQSTPLWIAMDTTPIWVLQYSTPARPSIPIFVLRPAPHRRRTTLLIQVLARHLRLAFFSTHTFFMITEFPKVNIVSYTTRRGATAMLPTQATGAGMIILLSTPAILIVPRTHLRDVRKTHLHPIVLVQLVMAVTELFQEKY
jgi:hypothetical protein